MSCLIAERARELPEAAAIIDQEKIWSYREVDGMVEAACRKIGVAPGERVAFLGKNDLQTIVLLFALLRRGAIACPLSTRLPVETIPNALTSLNARLIDNSTGAKPIDSDQGVATLLFTSGSTGNPKIAALTHDNFLASARGSNAVSRLAPSHRWLLSLPLFHVGGLALLFRCFLAGAAVLISHDLCDPRATHLSLVPTQLYRLLQQSKSLSHLEMILLGGAPVSSTLLGKSKHLPLRTTYGMTEMCSQITQDGDLLPGRELRIAADGEIWVRGETLFKGYWSQEKGYLLPVDDARWFPTRDLGRIADGKVLIVGRKDNLFISGGENIQPEEIEEALLSLSGIEQAVVVPISSEEFGARPAAYIYQEPRTYTPLQLRRLLEKKLPRFKHPVQLFFLDTPIEGKPQRAHLAQQAQDSVKVF